jgi:alkylated DNA repair dioxygenase AlkB
MNTLFPDQPVFPEGFFYFPDFLSIAEEQQLIEAVSALELRSLVFQGFTAKRKVESYGYDYDFDKRSISKGKPIPSMLDFLIAKVAEFLSFAPADLEEILVTEYPEGSVINWHRDAPPFDTIIGVSLLSECKFRLRPYEKSKQGRGATLSLNLEPRSLYIIRGSARSDWEHSIAPVKKQRYSITLRTLVK